MRTLVCMTLALFSFGALAPLAASAQAPNCSEASDQSTLNECANLAYAKSDAELNKRYKETRRRLNDQPHIMKRLVAAQKAWITFRDAECEFSGAGAQDGSAYPMLVSLCRDTLTQTRIKDFNTYLSCEEGDLGCPVPP